MLSKFVSKFAFKFLDFVQAGNKEVAFPIPKDIQNTTAHYRKYYRKQ